MCWEEGGSECGTPRGTVGAPWSVRRGASPVSPGWSAGGSAVPRRASQVATLSGSCPLSFSHLGLLSLEESISVYLFVCLSVCRYPPCIPQGLFHHYALNIRLTPNIFKDSKCPTKGLTEVPSSFPQAHHIPLKGGGFVWIFLIKLSDHQSVITFGKRTPCAFPWDLHEKSIAVVLVLYSHNFVRMSGLPCAGF